LDSERRDQTPDCVMTDFVVQIPWEITPPGELVLPTQIFINDNGTQSHPFEVVVVPEQIQILKTCKRAERNVRAGDPD
jgi:hypothetical protein